ncbi:ATP-binding cassette domain-containing protein [uncultured Tessaracoccus sp.]|uniref:ABC transporter ATP-binding protein/permease n=1 Tax=uncultured Tessaracoccus sp. TaxID=905023 RepID=UPI0025D4B783|nr:ATP-binding cassette domain-containing protein [uncultured Tessaracoccus sp.]
MHAPPMELRHVSHRYRAADRLALDDVNLTIGQGEFVAIVGPSGSGKSTLLNVLGLLERPTDGTHLVRGDDVNAMSEARRDRLRGHDFGFIFQSANVLGDESVETNAGLGLAIQGVPRKERTEPVATALDRVGLGHITGQAARLLSGGERQRLAVARALVSEPAAVFADEPTGSLDSRNGARVMELLRGLHAAGHTVVLVTHDQSLAAHAERRISMRDGRVVADERTDGGPDPAPRHTPSTDGGRMRAADVVDQAFGALLGRPQRAVLLLALVIGIAGLITARGIADSAASQVSTRLTAAARDGITATTTSTAIMWRPGDTTLSTLATRLHGIDHVAATAWEGSVGPSDVHVTRFDPTDPEPADAISVTAASPSLFDFLDAEVTPAHAPELLADEDLGNVAILTPRSAAALGIGPATDFTGRTIMVDGHRLPVVAIADPRDPDLSPLFATTVFVSRPALAHVEPARIALTFHARTEAGYPSTVAPAVPPTLVPANPASVSVRTVADLLGLRVGVADDMSSFVLVLAGVVLVLAVLAGGVGTYVSVVAKTAEIALRRSLGMSRHAVFWLFLVQSLVIGLVGGAIGALAGQLLSIAITNHLGWQPVLPTWAGPAGIAVGTVCGLVSGVVPAIVATRRSPAQAIRE